jgi:hypothetical protein
MSHTQPSNRFAPLHTLLLILTLVSLGTGLRLATMDHPWVLALSALPPQGLMHTTHLITGAGWIVLIVGALVYARSLWGAWRQRRLASPLSAWMSLGGLLALVVTLLSGTALYLDLWSFLPRLTIHFVSALFLGLYLLAHLSLKWIRKGAGVLPAIGLIPSTRGVWIALVGWLVGSIALLGWAQVSFSTVPLTVRHVQENVGVRIDGNASDPVWSRCPEATLVTFGGANFPLGQSRVRLKAFENGREFYLLVRWEDPDRSVRHLPLQKTPNGWTITANGFYRWDERTWYEDKFAILTTFNALPGAGGTAHLGPRPLPDKPPCWHHRGLHYTTDGSHLDLWQWKAVRINDMHQMDDEYFGPPEAVRVGSRRYKAGYHPDPKLSGGLTMNWTWYHRDTITPKRLPSDPGILAAYNQPNGTTDGYHSWYDYRPWSAKRDTLPVGTRMPSVLYTSNQYEGDRGDVRAYATWHNGWWTLEMVRFLQTPSHYDLPIRDGLRLWFAAFDHAQTAHSRSARAVQLHFEE